MDLDFSQAPLLQVYRRLREELSRRSEVAFDVLDPDRSESHYSGEKVAWGGREYVYRSLQTWMELAEQLSCRMLCPQPLGHGLVRITLRKLVEERSWHVASLPSGDTEKYGIDSDFSRIQKEEEPSFLAEMIESFQFLDLPEDASVLNLGVNRGDEFRLLQAMLPQEQFARMRFVGIDHSKTAINAAKQWFADTPNVCFLEADLRKLEELSLGRYDLLMSMGTLHSPHLDGHDIFMQCIQQHLTDRGGVLLGFPNSRYVDFSLRYGAKVKNYSRPELSVLWKEVTFYKRYLQQHRFRVTLTGKYTVCLTARR